MPVHRIVQFAGVAEQSRPMTANGKNAAIEGEDSPAYWVAALQWSGGIECKPVH